MTQEATFAAAAAAMENEALTFWAFWILILSIMLRQHARMLLQNSGKEF